MKKLMLFFGALCVAFSFMGCSGDSEQGEENGENLQGKKLKGYEVSALIDGKRWEGKSFTIQSYNFFISGNPPTGCTFANNFQCTNNFDDAFYKEFLLQFSYSKEYRPKVGDVHKSGSDPNILMNGLSASFWGTRNVQTRTKPYNQLPFTCKITQIVPADEENAYNISLTFEGKMDGINKIVTITEGKIKCIFE